MEGWKPDKRNGNLPCVNLILVKQTPKTGEKKTDDTSANTTQRDIRRGAVEKDGERFSYAFKIYAVRYQTLATKSSSCHGS